MLVSVVVPLFNEEEGIPDLVPYFNILRDAVEMLGHRVEFVFVDDGCTDGTSFALSVCFRARKDVRVVAHKTNLGFGAAFRTGVEEARGAVIVCCDADGPYPPEDAALLVEAVQGPEGADCATVSPWGPGGRAPGLSFLRRFLSRGASRLYRIALAGRGRGITCFTAAFRAYKGDVVRSLHWDADGFMATAEILTRMLRKGHRVVEIPATLRPRKHGSSKMRVLRTVRAHLGLMARLATGTLRDPPPEPETEPGSDSALR